MNRRNFLSLIGFAGAASLFAQPDQGTSQIDSIRFPVEEEGTPPRFLPGDIVKTKEGGYGIITEAKSCGRNWNSKEWGKPLSEWNKYGIASYALDSIPGLQDCGKSAWWTADEWEEVILGPLHKGRQNL